MNTPYHQQYLKTIAIVLQDIQYFINQKNHHSLIYSLLQIKKTARKFNNPPISQIDTKSNASRSNKNYSKRNSSPSVQSAAKSAAHQSQASFDLIKGAEIFNETKKKTIQDKIYTQTYPEEQYNFTCENQQRCTFSQLSQSKLEPIPKTNTMVPKLVGLVSSEEISDIEQPFRTESRKQHQKNIRNYDHSIQEVDDDDEFQDIVLNRLDVIQRKVNQMLKEKRHQRLSTLNSRVPLNESYHLSKSKLHNVGSGPNIIYSKNLNKTDFYQHPESWYPNSTALMSPKVFTFPKSKNMYLQDSSKKTINRSFKQNLTERNADIPKLLNPQNYFTDNEQYIEGDKLRNQQEIQDEVFDEAEDHQEFMKKNKKLEYYREYSKALNQQNKAEGIMRPSKKVESTLEKKVNDTNVKEQSFDNQAFKYIPLNKITAKKPGVSQKTDRKVPCIIQNHYQPNSKNNYTNKNNLMVVDQPGRNYQKWSQNNVHSQYQQIYQGQHRKKSSNKQDKHRSGRDSGIRSNQLDRSEVKAYTEHGDYIKNDENISVTSEKGIYSEIRELREITKLYGAERQKKYIQNHQNQKSKSPVIYIENRNLESLQGCNNRFNQKTQRNKYSSNRIQRHENEYDQEDQIIIEEDFPKERMVRVIKQMPHYPQIMQERIPRTQYVEHESHKQVVAGQRYVNYPYTNPVYLVRQTRQPVYKHVQQIYDSSYFGDPRQSSFQTVMLQQDIKSKLSHRKMSSGSMNSFKSIPYVKTDANPTINKEQIIEYFVERPSTYIQKPIYRNY